MSDGPFKTLKMTSKWKKVARVAEKGASESYDVQREVVKALKDDCVNESLYETVRSFLNNTAGESREQELLDRVNELKDNRNADSLTLDFASNLTRADFHSSTTEECVINALKDTFKFRLAQRERQMNEHYSRKEAHTQRRILVANLRNVQDLFDYSGFSKSIVSNKGYRLARRLSQGLDDGVRL